MFVTQLYTDNWTRNKNEENVIENPNWQQIKKAICDLNGNTKTLVSLEADNESYMMVGGGNHGKYIVTVTFDHEVFYSLVRQIYEMPKLHNRRRKIILRRRMIVNNMSYAHEIKLVVGGQEGNYSGKICVDLHQCLIAAITFYESGELKSLFTWKEDESLVTV
jgi:hypothetical protein